MCNNLGLPDHNLSNGDSVGFTDGFPNGLPKGLPGLRPGLLPGPLPNLFPLPSLMAERRAKESKRSPAEKLFMTTPFENWC